MNTKKSEIQNLVKTHPTLKQVPQYISNKYGLDKDKVYDNFIEFLCKESIGVKQNKICGVSCFVFDDEQKIFINKTIYSTFHT